MNDIEHVLNLKEYELGPHQYEGLTLGYEGWTGNPNVNPFWISQGFQGLHLKGKAGKTILHSNTSAASLILGRKVGYILVEDVIIKTGSGAGKQKAIFGGIDAANKPDLIPYTLHLRNCIIDDDVTPDPDGRPEWGVFTNQGDLILQNCQLNCTNTNEHAVYMHGFGLYGAYILDTEITGVGAEGLKFTARPQPRYYNDPEILAMANNAAIDGYHPIDRKEWIRVKNTKITDWHQPHSWRGGAGMTVQGVGINTWIKNCAFFDFNERKPAFAMDDSGVEHFGANNVGGGNPANEKLVMLDSIFASGPGPEWYGKIANIGTLIPGSNNIVATSIEIKNCGFYGERMIFGIDRVNGNVNVQNCNNAGINTKAQALGIDTSHEALLQYGGQLVPISNGLTS